MPSLCTPAYSVAGFNGSMIRSVTDPLFTRVHVTPESVDRNTPFDAVVTNNREGTPGSMSSTPAPAGVPRSLEIFVQFAVPSSERKIPAPATTANTRDGVTGSTARAANANVGRLSPTGIQDAPPSVVFQIPEPGP